MRTKRSKPPSTGAASRFAYWQEFTAVLCLKAAGITLLYLLFFAPADRPVVTQQTVTHHLLTMPVRATSDEVNHDR